MKELLTVPNSLGVATRDYYFLKIQVVAQVTVYFRTTPWEEFAINQNIFTLVQNQGLPIPRNSSKSWRLLFCPKNKCVYVCLYIYTYIHTYTHSTISLSKKKCSYKSDVLRAVSGPKRCLTSLKKISLKKKQLE